MAAGVVVRLPNAVRAGQAERLLGVAAELGLLPGLEIRAGGNNVRLVEHGQGRSRDGCVTLRYRSDRRASEAFSLLSLAATHKLLPGVELSLDGPALRVYEKGA